ncbi:isoniazid inducible protein IniA [Salinifilum aidingensis]
MIDTALVELIDRASAECAEQDRSDLHGRLRQIRTRVLDPSQLVLLIGEPAQGKSALLNAIVNAPVCAAGETTSTRVPTLVRHADTPSAHLVEQEAADGPPALERVPVPLEELTTRLQEAVDRGRPVRRGEVAVPRGVLRNGLALMDTPAFGGPSSAGTDTTLAIAAEADALLMISDATQELTTNEIGFLKQVADLCPNIALVQPKIDRTPHWRQVVEVNRKHLNNAGVSAKIFPVSCTVRAHAMRTKSSNLNKESGFSPLLEYLKSELAGQHDQLTRRLVSHNLGEAITQISNDLRAELAAQNPRTAAETLVELESAQRRAEELRRIASRWQKTLNDGVQDLNADVEFDFRERCWAVQHQVNEIFEQADPLEVWDDFRSWLDEQITAAIDTTFDWIEQRRQHLVRRVSEQMPDEARGEEPDLERLEPPRPLDAVPEPALPRGSDFRRFDRLLTGLRGSYGGVLMFGLVTKMAGLPLLNVLSLSAGILLGSKSLREEKDTRLRRRQTEAKNAAQRYIDQVVFQVNKESKDAIRAMHRSIHAHFNGITEQAQVDVNSSIQDIKRAAERSAVDRDQRAREIKQKLEDLSVLRKRVGMLTQNRIAAS